jgi:hypothetical protein
MSIGKSRCLTQSLLKFCARKTSHPHAATFLDPIECLYVNVCVIGSGELIQNSKINQHTLSDDGFSNKKTTMFIFTTSEGLLARH